MAIKVERCPGDLAARARLLQLTTAPLGTIILVNGTTRETCEQQLVSSPGMLSAAILLAYNIATSIPWRGYLVPE